MFPEDATPPRRRPQDSLAGHRAPPPPPKPARRRRPRGSSTQRQDAGTSGSAPPQTRPPGNSGRGLERDGVLSASPPAHAARESAGCRCGVSGLGSLGAAVGSVGAGVGSLGMGSRGGGVRSLGVGSQGWGLRVQVWGPWTGVWPTHPQGLLPRVPPVPRAWPGSWPHLMGVPPTPQLPGRQVRGSRAPSCLAT